MLPSQSTYILKSTTRIPTWNMTNTWNCSNKKIFKSRNKRVSMRKRTAMKAQLSKMAISLNQNCRARARQRPMNLKGISQWKTEYNGSGVIRKENVQLKQTSSFLMTWSCQLGSKQKKKRSQSAKSCNSSRLLMEVMKLPTTSSSN